MSSDDAGNRWVGEAPNGKESSTPVDRGQTACCRDHFSRVASGDFTFISAILGHPVPPPFPHKFGMISDDFLVTEIYIGTQG
jgi:hypothetical protein